ncbi:ABC transporter C family member 8-like isoform X1 [Panicum miliaceum]|uniref:ABC transporter C family member 8-like isoform X1 n=1 Tax=Panicum miliaceum TaxID=4540 RepID=A0A3L6RZX6_PANMI|nr:ABC transporter C family member 8-like isoform X1 [Panicum miliaceum]
MADKGDPAMALLGSSWACGELAVASPCVQRALIDCVNAAFLIAYVFALAAACVRRRWAGSAGRRSGGARGWRQRGLVVAVSACCVAAAVGYGVAGFRDASSGGGAAPYFARALFWIALAASLHIQPDRAAAAVAALWWALPSLLVTAYNAEVLLGGGALDAVEVVAWPVNLLLLLCALGSVLRRSDGQRHDASGGLSEPLIGQDGDKAVPTSELYRAGLFRQLAFSWLNPLLRLGRSKALDLADIPLIAGEDTAQHTSHKFAEAWSRHVNDKARGRRSVGSNSLALVLGKCFLGEILLTGFYAFLRTLAIAVAPLMLFAFVWYSNQQERDLRVGLALVGCLLLMKLVESLSQRHWFFDSRRTGMHIRSALMAVIFQKQLRLSSQGRKNHSTGEIVNYIAVDAYRLGDAISWLHMGWSSPLQLVFAVATLFWALKLGALPGLVPLVIFGFLNVPFAKILQGYQSKFMVAQDKRLRSTSEILNSMKIIKLQSWEEKFRNMIGSLRDGEFKWLRETQMKKAYGAVMYWMSPTVVSAVMYTATAIMGSAPLNASTLFTVLATLRVMSEPVRFLPEILTMMIQYKVSLDRIERFLLEDEIREEDVKRVPSDNSDIRVQVQDGNFSWNANIADLSLRNVNLSISRGEKVAVCGPVGSGKSSLLYALLGEIPRISGSVEVFGSVAYVSQNSWIQSGTVRDNILFGKPFNKEVYEKAIKSCALDKDIENFDHGDLTEIGQRGLNMSGGQKQRIQLARAVYNDADVYLLDDPFSAVDAHTAAVLFYDCVMTALAEKTVVLVTHQVEFLTETSRILVMEGGQVSQQGKYSELLKSGTAFEKLVSAHQSSITALDTSASQQNQVQGQLVPDENIVASALQATRQASDIEVAAKGPSATIQLTEEEEKGIGDLGWKPYKDYINVSQGAFQFSGMCTSQVLFTCFQIASTYWLAVAVQMDNISAALLVGAYSGLSIFSCCFAYFRSLFAATLGLKASKAFFSGLMDSVFKAPMSFFDSTPVGRILTRASSDLSILDFDIPYSMAFVTTGSIEVVTTVLVMGTVTWEVLIVAIPVTITMIYVQRYYVSSARELVRINGTTKAPVMNYASESILGVVTIRAFTATERFIHSNMELIDTDATLFFHTVAAQEWVLIRVEALQSLTIITAALFLVLVPPGVISPGFAGLCLSYALTLTAAQVFLTRFYSYLENYIISVERIKQYMHLPAEPPAIIPENRPPASWPQEGRIELQDLKIRYRPNAPLVLKGITCTFAAGNKIGVVGRTGSGKSTLISSLFRLVDPAGGRILIDKLDICSIGLKDLRTKLSIIPQEPTLFRGTVRNNLDPLGLHSDQEIWEALEKCQLKAAISSTPALLDTVVSDDGDNWSSGQRQLFCLGRVLLHRNKILVLDEATASIDSATDAILQKVIRQQFSSCTVITIAHRVPTVTDSDTVLVLSYGKLLEYETPAKLLEDKQSAFAKLVAEYWANTKRNST